jgi:hypothetical protein
MSLEREGGMIYWQGKTEELGENICPSAILFTTNPTWFEPGANPGLRGERPATNDLSDDTATRFLLYSHVCGVTVSPYKKQNSFMPSRMRVCMVYLCILVNDDRSDEQAIMISTLMTQLWWYMCPSCVTNRTGKICNLRNTNWKSNESNQIIFCHFVVGNCFEVEASRRSTSAARGSPTGAIYWWN